MPKKTYHVSFVVEVQGEPESTGEAIMLERRIRDSVARVLGNQMQYVGKRPCLVSTAGIEVKDVS